MHTGPSDNREINVAVIGSSSKADVDAAVAEVMESQHFILGPAVERCERAGVSMRAYNPAIPRLCTF